MPLYLEARNKIKRGCRGPLQVGATEALFYDHDPQNRVEETMTIWKEAGFFLFLINLFIFGCIGSSLLLAGFL